MAADPHPLLVEGFGSVGDRLKWFCEPSAWETAEGAPGAAEGVGGHWSVDEDGQLVIGPPSKKDFWRKTYYTPVLCKDDGPCLFATVGADETVMVETAFTLVPKKQFDQAGICVRLDNEHWCKTGIEVVDGAPRLSCVVCNGYSDWSTQPWPVPALRIRLHKIGHSIVVEAGALEGEEWTFVRM